MEESGVENSNQNLVYSQVEPQKEVAAVGHHSETDLRKAVPSVSLVIFKEMEVSLLHNRI
jgi:hypothetical protein